MPDATVEDQLLDLRSNLVAGSAHIRFARALLSELDRSMSVHNPAAEIAMLKTRGGRRKIARTRAKEVSELERGMDQARAAAVMLGAAASSEEEVRALARATSPKVRAVLRRTTTIDALNRGAGTNKSRQAYVAKLKDYSPTQAGAAMGESLTQAWAMADFVSTHLVQRVMTKHLVWGVAAPVRAPLKWGLEALPVELTKLHTELADTETLLCAALARCQTEQASAAARRWARQGRSTWEAVVPYARALDNWANARGSKRRLIPQQIDLSLQVAEVGRASLRAIAAGLLCDLALAGDGPRADGWIKAAAGNDVTPLAQTALGPVQWPDDVFAAAASGDSVRITGAVKEVRSIQVNRDKRIHVLVISSPGDSPAIAVLPYFNPISLGLKVGSAVQLSGKLQTDALAEFVNNNTRRSLDALAQEYGTRQGLAVARFEPASPANGWVGWVAATIRPAFDVAPSSISGLWSLQPGLEHVVARKTWHTDPPEKWRRNLSPLAEG